MYKGRLVTFFHLSILLLLLFPLGPLKMCSSLATVTLSLTVLVAA